MMYTIPELLIDDRNMEDRPARKMYRSMRSGSRRFRKTQRTDRIYKTIFSADQESNGAELRFLNAVHEGDLTETMACAIQEQVNVNCVDFLGRNALELAAEGDHVEVIEFLLLRCNGQTVQDALLHTVSLGRTHIVEILLTHPVYKSHKFNIASGMFYNKRTSDNPRFSSDITPIMLAAQLNNYSLVQMLLIQGARIAKPHDYNCHCTECQNMRVYDSVKYSRTRLNAFRGLASTAYLSLANDDPLIAAFKLSHELDYLETVEREYQAEYRQLNNKCKNYAVQLLNQCRASEEVMTILAGPANKKKHTNQVKLQNLSMAIKYDQKRFIAHSVVQRQMSLIWYDNVPWLRNRSAAFMSMLVPLAFILYPILSLIYLFAPIPKIVKYMETPFIKFVHHGISYCMFLLLILVASARAGQIWVQLGCDSSAQNTQQFAYLAVECLIYCWVAGMFAYEIKQVYSAGIRKYTKDWWNWVDMTLISSYLVSLSLFLVTFSQISHMTPQEKAVYCEAHKTELLTTAYCEETNKCRTKIYENTNFQCEFDIPLGSTDYYNQYLNGKTGLNMPEPQQLADIIFALANTLSFMRLAYLLPASNHLGPLMISFGRMLKDGFKFCIIFALVFLAFLAGLTSLYKIDPCENNYFVRIDLSVISLFWATFGMGDPNAPIIDARNRHYNSTSTIERDVGLMLTEIFGYFLFACYIVSAVIVLMNMLIAMMSNTFQEIFDDSDVEWKFARTELWMTYVQEENTLPPPFNIIPGPFAIYNCFKMLVSKDETDEGGFVLENHGARNARSSHWDDMDKIGLNNGARVTRMKSTSLSPYDKRKRCYTTSQVMSAN